ncbi:MAG: twin-arginine translocase subunit TatC [Flavobacteriaceae bacterium]|nr:twin-arginine translocase subunit TatC [Flavobacteriaceae bacterium]
MNIKKNFFEQLLELRSSLIKALLIFVVTFAALTPFANDMYHFFALPLLEELAVLNGSMISTKLAATFLIPLKITALVAFIASYPITFYQLWKFISPGLYKNEKAFTSFIFFFSFLLFMLAAGFVYFIVFPVIFHFFVLMTPDDVDLMIDISSYLDMIIALFIAFGLAFQIPLLIISLVKFGWVEITVFQKSRSYFLAFSFVFGAIFTPPDILSQVLLALPVYFLYEIGIFLSKKIKLR